MPLRRGRPASRWPGLPWAVGLTCVLTVWLVAPAGAVGPRKLVAPATEPTTKALTKCTFAALQKAAAAADGAAYSASLSVRRDGALHLGRPGAPAWAERQRGGFSLTGGRKT